MNQLQVFQRRQGLIADGIIGPVTLGAMQRAWKLTKPQLAHFIGQVSHETGHFRYEQENLNYSASALLNVFGKYFNVEKAKEYAYNPQAIANIVYGNRMGNDCKGDGWKYRGRGAIQLTGKNNYERFASKIGDLQILENPDIVVKKYFFESALFYFTDNHLWHLCDEVDNNSIIQVTKRVNGGLNGLQDRIELTYKFWNILNR